MNTNEKAIAALKTIEAVFRTYDDTPDLTHFLDDVEIIRQALTAAQSAPVVDVEALKRECFAEFENVQITATYPAMIARKWVSDVIDHLAASGYLKTPEPVPTTDYSEYYRPEKLYYTMCGKIYAKHKDGSSHMFMDVRGWGHLTGGGAKALPHDLAAGIQDAWAKEVCDLWNNKTPSPPPVADLAALERAQSELHEKYYGQKRAGGMHNETFETIRALLDNAIAAQKGGAR